MFRKPRAKPFYPPEPKERLAKHLQAVLTPDSFSRLKELYTASAIVAQHVVGVEKAAHRIADKRHRPTLEIANFTLGILLIPPISAVRKFLAIDYGQLCRTFNHLHSSGRLIQQPNPDIYESHKTVDMLDLCLQAFFHEASKTNEGVRSRGIQRAYLEKSGQLRSLKQERAEVAELLRILNNIIRNIITRNLEPGSGFDSSYSSLWKQLGALRPDIIGRLEPVRFAPPGTAAVEAINGEKAALEKRQAEVDEEINGILKLKWECQTIWRAAVFNTANKWMQEGLFEHFRYAAGFKVTSSNVDLDLNPIADPTGFDPTPNLSLESKQSIARSNNFDNIRGEIASLVQLARMSDVDIVVVDHSEHNSALIMIRNELAKSSELQVIELNRWNNWDLGLVPKDGKCVFLLNLFGNPSLYLGHESLGLYKHWLPADDNYGEYLGAYWDIKGERERKPEPVILNCHDGREITLLTSELAKIFLRLEYVRRRDPRLLQRYGTHIAQNSLGKLLRHLSKPDGTRDLAREREELEYLLELEPDDTSL